MKTEVKVGFVIFPLTFNVPPETVKVPLLVNRLLFKVHPTVKSPDTMERVLPAVIVTFFETFPAEFTVTIVPAAIVTKSLQVGANPLFQVVVADQSPFAIETKGTSAAAIPTYISPAVT